MPSEPLRSFNSPCSLMRCFAAKSCCFSFSWVARSSRPSFFFSSEITSSRNVRWSRKNKMLVGSFTFASLHVTLEENGCHRRHVFVAETQIGAGKACVARLHKRNANISFMVEHVFCEDL